MNRRIPLFFATISVLALTACSSSPTDEPEGANGSTPAPGATAAECADTQSGSASEAVTVTGEVGTAPEVSIDAPVEASTTERTIVTEGDGAEIEPGDQAKIAIAVYNGTTGEVVDALPYSAEQPVPFPVDDTLFLPGIVRAVECTTVGSRIVAVTSPEDSFAAEALTELGLSEGDSTVFVIDVLDKMADRATGVDQPAQEGLPTVELAEDGQPTVTIPEGDAPTELQIAVLKEGDGAVVQEGDSVTVQYQGTLWATGEVFDESWGKAPATFVTSQVVPGFGKALVGQKVGSQVLAVLPPAEGYGEAGQPDAGISGTDTLVFVVDILDTTAAAPQG
ncbi:FKBP-type peptidyl-prolyl cis-trans isomerase [Planctomonas psychrotolerans]|uniref:FKBP-type peptidyl-prolyl cis-trans isomerase n=1 Tax=Planctomonas psychrotolerans TaxID=2528712 RepID=UPI00123AA7E2|nr:FKBP-type peptidyl-prolyl cis-trans isomerase [Planctomonas psychrotolerans]